MNRTNKIYYKACSYNFRGPSSIIYMPHDNHHDGKSLNRI